MLSNEEKSKIELEEQYRIEVNSKLKTSPKIDVIEKSIKILQGLAIIIGIWATYYEYKKQNEEEIQREQERYEQTAKEYRMHFYQRQLDFYVEATETTATLATEEMESEDYKEARKHFFRLFWGKLSIVEDRTVEDSMIKFRKVLIQYEKAPNNFPRDSLEQASLALAHNASKYTINVWLDSAERRKYNR